MDGDLRYAWPTDGAFHRGYVDGLQGRAKRARQGEEYEDGYACGCGDAAPDAADRHVRAAMALESLFGGDDLAAVSEGFEMGYDDARGHFAYGPPTRLLGTAVHDAAQGLVVSPDLEYALAQRLHKGHHVLGQLLLQVAVAYLAAVV